MSHHSPQDSFTERGREIRVFISSTFRDMQAEREHLIKHVFPEINHICRERGITFTDIDLRWGITEQQAEKKQIVRACLDELHNRHPFVIGIIGSRYGWVPPIEEVSNPEMLRIYPAIRAAAAQGSSMVEIEIMEGVLRNPSMKGRALFYFRDPSVETEKLRESPAAQERLEGLKRELRTSGFPVREAYTSLHMFGEWIRQDLMHLIDTTYPADDLSDPLAEERRAHQSFAMTRSRAYVEVPQYLARLDAHAAEEGPPLAVTGMSGMGKSALLAHWSERYRREHPEAFVITHFIGATSHGGDHLAVIRHIMMEIKARYRDITEDIPTRGAKMVSALSGWLGQIQHEKLILVIDGLNQLDAASQGLDWLDHIQPRVRLIVSTLEGTALDTINERDWPTLTVAPLTLKARRAIVKRYLAEYGKRFTSEQLRRIAADPASAIPLILKTRLEELRTFGSYEKLNERIEHYLSAETLDELFDRVLERLETDYGKKLVTNVMALLWGSRGGLSEAELLALARAKRADLSKLLFALDYHLCSRDGLLTFFHDYLRTAVATRYGMQGAAAQALHGKIAAFFAGQEISPRRLDEQPWQLQKAGAWKALADCITEERMFRGLSTEARKYELLGYVMASENARPVFDLYRRKLDTMARRRNDGGAATAFAKDVGDLALLAARFDIAGRFLTAALRRQERSTTKEPEAVVSLLRSLGSLSIARGEYRQAEGHLHKALRWCEQQQLPEPILADVLDGLTNLYYEWRRPLDAIGAATRSLEIRRRSRGNEHRETIAAMQDLGACLYANNELRGAGEHFTEALRLCRRVLGGGHPLTAKLLNNIAAATMAGGDHADAVPHLREALAIHTRMLGWKHIETASTLINLGYALKVSGDNDGAEGHYREAIAIWEQLLGGDHPVLARHLITLATVLADQGRYDEAEALSHRALDIRIARLSEDHRDTIDARLNLASVWYWQKRYRDALEIFDTYFAVAVGMLGEHHRHIMIYQEIHAELLVACGLETELRPLRYLLERRGGSGGAPGRKRKR